MTTHLGLQRIMIPSAQVSSLTTGSITLPSARGEFLSSDMYSIASAYASSGTQAYFEFTDIPQTYKHLELRYNLQGATSDDVMITINGASSGYFYTLMSGVGNNTSGSVGRTINSSSAFIGRAPTASSGANYMGAGVAHFGDYTATDKIKTFISFSGADLSSSGIVSYFSGGINSNSAITSIRILCQSGSWSQYSRCALYGIAGS